MTLANMRTEVWKQLGEPTDLDPSTDTSFGGSPWLNLVLNQAQDAIASWKDPETGTITKIDSLYSKFYFKADVKTDTLDDDATSTTEVILPAGMVGDDDDRYNGWILKVGGISRLVTDYDTATRTATVSQAFDSAPSSGDSVSLYHSFFYILPVSHNWVGDHIQAPAETDRYRSTGNINEVLKISDINDRRELKTASRGENFISRRVDTGDPQEWYRYGNQIIFDVAPGSTKWYEVEYYRLPTGMSSDTDEPDLPEQYHYALILWAVRWGLERDHENDEAYARHRRLIDLMRRIKSQRDMLLDRTNDYGRLEVK